MKRLFLAAILALSVSGTWQAMEWDSSSAGGIEESFELEMPEEEPEPGVTMIIENKTDRAFGLYDKIRAGIMLQEKFLQNIQPGKKFEVFLEGLNGYIVIRRYNTEAANLMYSYSDKHRDFEVLLHPVNTARGFYVIETFDTTKGDPVEKHQYQIRIILKGDRLQDSKVYVETAK